MVVLLAALVQAVTPPAPQPPMVAVSHSAPPIRAVAVPPPNPPILVPRIAAATPREPIMVRVRVTAGSQTLMADRFRIGASSASFTQQRSEATAAACSGFRDMARRTSLNFSLYPVYDPDQKTYHVSVSWARPGSDGCAAPQRTIGVEQPVELVAGRRVVVEGDGGLRIEMTRE